jgi:hypothetical protein
LALKTKEPRSNIFSELVPHRHYPRFIDAGVAVEKWQRGAN